TYRGLRASGLYSFGGTPGQFGRNSIWSLGVGYTGGPIVLGAAYDYTRGYGVNHVTYQQGDLGITYILSKRTQLYLVGLY
uniref:porin n=1 Tax=Burkholderia gladioli TaxID=28095 RepID=UPI001640784F